MRKVQLWPSFYRQCNGSKKRLNNWHKIAQLVSDRAETWTHILWKLSFTLFTWILGHSVLVITRVIFQIHSIFQNVICHFIHVVWTIGFFNMILSVEIFQATNTYSRIIRSHVFFTPTIGIQPWSPKYYHLMILFPPPSLYLFFNEE